MRDAAPLTNEGQIQFPNSYLAIEPLTGPSEVWFLTGWNSIAEIEQVGERYKNAPPQLVAALERNAKKKADVTLEPVTTFARYRSELSRGDQWRLGWSRFLVIAETFGSGPFDGTLFETDEHVRLVVASAPSLKEANEKAGPEARVFAVRPYWSRPAKEWVASDPEFWQV